AAVILGRRNAKRPLGINENLAREIMELHTLGVGSGYTQTDVTTFAEVITGWSIGGEAGRFSSGEPGKFVFRAELHEPGAKVVLGKRYPDKGIEQGEAVLRDIAARPATAHFLATKLCRHFIADDPPTDAVEHVARAFSSSGVIFRRCIRPCSRLPLPGRGPSPSTRRPPTISSPPFGAWSCRWATAARRWALSKRWVSVPTAPGRRPVGRIAATTGAARRR